jgi:uncharacterized membrane protein YadS
MLSDPVGDTATVVKLMRVACLLPVVMIVTLAVRAKPAANGAECGGKRPALVPGFLMGFAGLMALNSSGLVPAVAADALSDLSGYALILAIAALGVKTSVRELICAGGSACTLLVVQTLGLGLVVAAVVTFAPAFA